MIGIFGGGAAAAFALLHGAGQRHPDHCPGHVAASDLRTNYAYRLGLIGAPSRICQVLVPLAFSLLIEPTGHLVVVVSGLSLMALLCLMALRRNETAEAMPRAAEERA